MPFMPGFAQPNVTGWIIYVDLAENNALLALVDAPYPLDPVAYPDLRRHGDDSHRACCAIPFKNPWFSDPIVSIWKAILRGRIENSLHSRRTRGQRTEEFAVVVQKPAP